ncbi:hypothetical protein IAU59_000720 [Kwoniella sp. CBS 9459]
MQRYQPPHARRQQAQTWTPAGTGNPTETSTSRAPATAIESGPSRYGSTDRLGPSATAHTTDHTRWGRYAAGHTGRLDGPRSVHLDRGLQDAGVSVRASALPSASTSASDADRYTPRASKKDWSSTSTSSFHDHPSSPSRNAAHGRGTLNIRGRGRHRGSGQDLMSGSVLASPASDIKPMRSRAGTPGTPGTSDEVQIQQAKMRARDMEMLQSVSRSGGDGAEGDALKDWTTQKQYREYIDERIAAHYISFSTPRHVRPAKDSTEENESLGSIVLLFRKLREGVVASGRIDRFAIEVFESSVQFAILAGNRPQLISSLSGLVPGLYKAFDKQRSDPNDYSGKGKGPVAETTEGPELQDKLYDLTLSRSDYDEMPEPNTENERRARFASLLLLYQLVVLGQEEFWATYFALTLEPPSRNISVSKDRWRSRYVTVCDDQEAQHQQPQTSTAGVTSRQVDASPRTHVAIVTHAEKPFISDPASSPSISFALNAARSTSHTSFNPLRYFTLLNTSTHTQHSTAIQYPDEAHAFAYERAILSWMEDDIRDRAWQLLGRSYISCGTEWAEKILGLGLGSALEPGPGRAPDESDMEKFVVEKGKKVELGMVKFR